MRYTNRERYEAIQLVRGRGMALREVGSTCGVFRTTVGRWYREDGIPFAHGPHGSTIVDARKRRGAGSKAG